MGVQDFENWREWLEIPPETREMLLHNAWCPWCHGDTFAPGWRLTRDEFGLRIEGRCAECGHEMVRCLYG